jgi:hypothetical protein
MKKLGMLGIIGGAALLTVVPFSLQWPQDEVSLSLNSVNARPLTATSACVHRRVYRRTYRRAAYATAAAGVAGYGYGSFYGYPSYSSYYAPQPYWNYGPVSYYVRTTYYPYPPPGGSYYIPPFASVNSYAHPPPRY